MNRYVTKMTNFNLLIRKWNDFPLINTKSLFLQDEICDHLLKVSIVMASYSQVVIFTETKMTYFDYLMDKGDVCRLITM